MSTYLHLKDETGCSVNFPVRDCSYIKEDPAPYYALDAQKTRVRWGDEHIDAEVFGRDLHDLIHGKYRKPIEIDRVIFNDPATIVFWKGGDKTVVKCMDGDAYSKEVGLAMCVCKRVFGDKYHRVFKDWV